MVKKGDNKKGKVVQCTKAATIGEKGWIKLKRIVKKKQKCPKSGKRKEWKVIKMGKKNNDVL